MSRDIFSHGGTTMSLWIERAIVAPGTALIRVSGTEEGRAATAPACPLMRVRVVATAAGIAHIEHCGERYACAVSALTIATLAPRS